MCGIAGYICDKKVDKVTIFQTLEKMKNRGPDAQNFFTKKIANKKFIGLLHSRLKIIDLKTRSNQPFEIDELIIVFNGEIYNYIELRKNLEKKKIKLRTKSDTEVLLLYFKIYGERCVDYFEGMWSFAIYDKKEDFLFLSRDRFGEKPLFYLIDNDSFFFGSEIKFIQQLYKKKLIVNHSMIQNFLINGYRFINKTNNCFFEKVRKLKSGHSIVIKNGKVKSIFKYWNKKVYQNEKISLNDALVGTRIKLINSLKLRTRADVPVAFCLSGGLDSTILASLAAKELNLKFKTFSIIDEDVRYNERSNIIETINDLGCKYELIKLKKIDFIEKMESLISYHDSPVSTISYFIHSLISEKASKEGYKVIISGTGADELFTGYYDHFIYFLKEIQKYNFYNESLQYWNKYIKNILRNPILKTPNSFLKNDKFKTFLYDSWRKNLNFMKSKKFKLFDDKKKYNDLLRNRMFNELFYEVIPVILEEDDMNSMMNSMENRSPYLDTDLYKFAFSIPTRHLIKKAFSKYILRESMKHTISRKIRSDRQKKGFNASLLSLINLKKSDTHDYFLDTRSKIADYVELKKVKKIFQKNELDNATNKFLFSFMSCKIFLERFG